MKCGLLGGKLGHSFSPQIHGALADYRYTLWEKTPEELYEYITEMLNRRESYYRQADYRFDADGYESLDSVDEAVHRLAVLMQNPAYGDGADEI